MSGVFQFYFFINGISFIKLQVINAVNTLLDEPKGTSIF